MTEAILTGSFDPITKGHINLAERASCLFDKVRLVGFVNPDKKYLFGKEQRIEMMKASTAHIENLTVDFSSGLVADYVREHRINVIVRGIRSTTELEYELSMAVINKKNSGADTVFLPADPELAMISSSLARENLNDYDKLSEYLPVSALALMRKYLHRGTR